MNNTFVFLRACPCYHHRFAEGAGDEFNHIFTRFDVDSSGSISKEEFGALHKYVQARAMFKSFDKLGAGSLDKKATTKALKKMGHKCKKEDVELIFEHYDANSSGGLDVEEFMELFTAHPCDPPPSPQPRICITINS